MLSVKNIYKTYHHNPSILAGIDLHIEEGIIAFLFGESGSGKSSLIKIIAGILSYDEGKEAQIRLGKVLMPAAHDTLVRGYKGVKILEQNSPLFPHHSIEENLGVTLRHYTKAYQTKRVKQLLRLCRLEEVAHKLPQALSGGELQRIALACSIAEKPDLLLLDEPFSHLDMITKTALREDFFNILKENKITTLCVSHDPQEALQFAHRIFVIRNGRIQQQGSPKEIYQKPANKYIAKIFGNANFLKPRFCEKHFQISKTALVRTQNITVSQTKGWRCRVVSERYLGYGYEIGVELDNQFLKVFVSEVPLQESLYVQIEKKDLYFFKK